MSKEENSESKMYENACKDTFIVSTDSLSSMFDTGFELFNNLNKHDKATNSSEIQSTVRDVIKIFENATKLVSLVDMFSNNERFEEIATENIKYFLLPVLLGILNTKICEMNNRLHIIDLAEIYFVDYLKRLKSYGLIDIEVPKLKYEKSEQNRTHTSSAEYITNEVNTRNTKIQRYRYQKELEKNLEMLKKNINNPNIDEESRREYFVTLLKIYANQAIDELDLIATERPILEHMKNVENDFSSHSNATCTEKKTSTKLHPTIITRDALQKKIYGIGYPSLPVLTVEEFYDKKVKDGEWPKYENKTTTQISQNSFHSNIDEHMENVNNDEKKEEKIERDDPNTLAQERAMDEYKDIHRRGWGNRYNRS